jgi:hypothetical protein
MLRKVTLRPGINRDTTNYANEGGYYECDKIRFYSGYPQKLGGWVEATTERFLGTCRQLWNWVTSFTDNFLAVGTDQKVYIEVGGLYYDITPIRNPLASPDQEYTFKTPTTDNCIDTTNGSTTVNINITAHGCLVGDYITIAGSADVGGIPSAVLNTEHKVTEVTDTNNFKIVVSTAATSTVTNGGGTSIFVGCQIHPGFPLQTAGYGWGTGGFGGTTGLSAIGTFTVTVASPAVLTFAAHTPVDNTVIILSTTGALPTGLSAGVAYYIVGSSGSTCSLALTQAGASINTTGTQSGTHSAQLVASPTGWGFASPLPVYLPQRDWFFDNFDNDLVMNIRAVTTGTGVATGGPIYYWSRGTTVSSQAELSTRAVLLSGLTIDGVVPADVPESAYQILVSQNDKHLLAFGCQPYAGSTGDFDPLLIRWATQDQPNVWTPLLTNSAGFIRVSRGSRIVRALPTRQEIVVFTDTHLYSFQFLGTIEVFGLQELSDNISIMSARSCISVNNVTYWMGLDKFYAYDGRVQTLPCTLREYVFKDINLNQADQVICGTNEGYNEVWWFYCSASSNWVDRYVIFNHLERVWYYGSLTRTAWLDVSSRNYPTAVFTDENQDPGILYTHELGVDDGLLPMEAFVQSSDFDIEDGEKLMLTKRMIPDVNFRGSTAANPEVTMAIRARNFPGSAFTNNALNEKPVIQTSIDQYTEQVFIRARGRQMAMRISSDGLGVQWQLGMPRIDAREDGKR